MADILLNSSGGDILEIAENTATHMSTVSANRRYFEFQADVVKALMDHEKVLVVELQGPVFGMVAGRSCLPRSSLGNSEHLGMPHTGLITMVRSSYQALGIPMTSSFVSQFDVIYAMPAAFMVQP